MFQRKVVEKIRPHILCSLTLFSPENGAAYETAWKNLVDADRLQMTGRRMRVACWVPKATDTLGVCNTYCFSAATRVARMHLNVTLWYIACVV